MIDKLQTSCTRSPAGVGIDPGETINDLVARRPELMPVLQSFGFDLCCGGALSLREAAEHHDVSLPTLLTALAGAPVQVRA